MPLITDFQLPSSASQLEIPKDNQALYIIFVTSDDPLTGQSWCPDVRAAWPILNATFSAADAPPLVVIEVGQKLEWKDPQNVYRTVWKVPRIPTLFRYERVHDAVVETGKLIEGEILDKKKLGEFIGKSLV